MESSSSTTNNGFRNPPPKPLTRSDTTTNPYPTTFVQADTSSFKQVVQMLTGSNETASKHTSSSSSSSKAHAIPPMKTLPKKQQQSGFRLYERRNSLKNNLKINPLNSVNQTNSSFSPRNHEILSPSILDFPSLVLSPVTPLIQDPFGRSASPAASPMSNAVSPINHVDKEAEEKAIKEKKFYLHPSPGNTPRGDGEGPKLLPLFPTTSPRSSGCSSSSCSDS